MEIKRELVKLDGIQKKDGREGIVMRLLGKFAWVLFDAFLQRERIAENIAK